MAIFTISASSQIRRSLRIRNRDRGSSRCAFRITVISSARNRVLCKSSLTGQQPQVGWATGLMNARRQGYNQNRVRAFMPIASLRRNHENRSSSFFPRIGR